MIFVTVGNSNIGFNRLIREMDKIAPSLPYRVFAQVGNSSYVPRNIEYARFLPYSGIKEYIKNSKVIITHAGAGTMLDILMNGKKPIVVPRLSKFGEVTDDHQLEITRALEAQGLIYPVYDINNLRQVILYAIKDTKKIKKTNVNKPSKMIRILGEILDGI